MSDDKTKWIFDDGNTEGGDEKTQPPSDSTKSIWDNEVTGPNPGSETPTIHLPQNELTGRPQPAHDATIIYTSGSAQPNASEDPVTGWLVVVKGPGSGAAATLGVGVNTVGRGPTARCSLPFGDTMISSEDHVRIIYDDEERVFVITHGAGKNVSRVNGQLLVNPVPLEDGAIVDLSKVTKARFRAFCGADFDWGDMDDAAGSDA